MDLHYGTEHAVGSGDLLGLVVKVTIPPKFGLVPKVVRHPLVNLRDDPTVPAFREALEFIAATPLEYLERWVAAIDVFGDDVRLASVVRWADGLVSFVVTQPQHHGSPADPREIDLYFDQSGWTRVPDPSRQHVLFFNYAFGILAIDALPRNCYLNEDGLLPFDVILCRPDVATENPLHLFPQSRRCKTHMVLR